MAKPRPKTIKWTVVGLLGVGLLLLGGYVGSNAYERMGTCGDFDVTVEQVPESAVDSPDQYEPFASLDDQQQAVFERALANDGETLADGSMDHFGYVRYEGDYYRVTPSVRVCDFSPEQFLWLGLGVALAGAAMIVGAALGLRRPSESPD